MANKRSGGGAKRSASRWGDRLTGAQSLMRSMEQEGVDVDLRHPRRRDPAAYDPLIDSSIRHVLMRHEQGAGHAAEGYARATGGSACAWAPRPRRSTWSRPSPTRDGLIPVVAITGQVPTR